MWEITSPRSADIPDKDLEVILTDRRVKGADGNPRRYPVSRHFKPDGLAMLREPSGEITLNVLETDNNTNNPADIRAKFEAFISYGNRINHRFPKLIELYARKHHLDIPDPDDVLIRYLFVASNLSNDHKRRNQAQTQHLRHEPQTRCNVLPSKELQHHDAHH